MERFVKIRFLFARVTFRNRPVVKKTKIEEDVVEEVLRYCPREYRMMCYVGARDLNINLAAVAEAGRDVATAVALAIDDVATGDYKLSKFWRYLKTGEGAPDVDRLLKKWGSFFRKRKRL